jgi:site-specific DNA-methyltransferase (adenine-specific)
MAAGNEAVTQTDRFDLRLRQLAKCGGNSIVLEKSFIIQNRITLEREKGRGAKKNWKNNSKDVWFATVSDEFVFHVDQIMLRRKVIAPYKDSSGCPKDWNETHWQNRK